MKLPNPSTLLLAAALPAQASIAYDTFGPLALKAEATFEQVCCGLCYADATVNGLTLGCSIPNSGGRWDFWAVVPNQNVAQSILWTFRGGPHVVDALQVLTWYCNVARYGLHRIGDFTLEYTTDATPTLNGTFSPLANVQLTGATITANRVKVTSPGSDDYRITFAPVVATGIKLTNAPNSGFSNNGNYAISEVSFRTLVAGVGHYGTATPGPLGPPRIGVSLPPQVNTPGFAIVGENGTQSGAGALLLSAGTPPRVSVSFLGMALWVQPPILVVPVQANQTGYVGLVLPIPNDPRLRSLSLTGQYAWLLPNTSGLLSASDGLQIVIR